MKTSTFLTFVGDNCGKAQEAMQWYTSLFPNSKIKSVQHFQEGESGGTPELVKYGVFSLNGTEYKISENNYNHGWTFTPGVSIFIESQSESEIVSLFKELSAGGQVKIPLDSYETGDYGFGKKFGWCADKYGVSWQFLWVE